MVKTRRRNYRNVTFDDEDDVREVSSTTSEESGGSDEGAVNDDPGGAVVGEESGEGLGRLRREWRRGKTTPVI